jgi:hypothetical protein
MGIVIKKIMKQSLRRQLVGIMKSTRVIISDKNCFNLYHVLYKYLENSIVFNHSNCYIHKY